MLRWIHDWYTRRVADRYATTVLQSMQVGEVAEMIATVKDAQQRDPVFRALLAMDHSGAPASVAAVLKSRVMQSALEPALVLNNPLLIPYRRSALRLLPLDVRAALATVPIIPMPSFQFDAFACRFRTSGRYFVAFPISLVFALQAMAPVILGVYNTDERADRARYVDALRKVAARLEGPTPVMLQTVEQAVGKGGVSRLLVIHFMHLVAVFILLHELGHVSGRHEGATSEVTDEDYVRLKRQEIEADRFAMSCLLRAHGGTVTWDDTREMHTLFVCQLLYVLELYLDHSERETPPDYPTLAERRGALLDHFAAPRRLRESLEGFGDAIGVAL